MEEKTFNGIDVNKKWKYYLAEQQLAVFIQKTFLIAL